MPDNQNREIVRIPLIIPEENTLVTFHGGALLETEKQPSVSIEMTAKQYVDRCLGLTAAKALGPVGNVEHIHGYALYPTTGQPIEIQNAHRMLITTYDIDKYLTGDISHDQINLLFVREALAKVKALH